MSEAIPYESISEVYATKRWDPHHKFCLRIALADGTSALFQAPSSYLRDQWLHSILWSKQVSKFSLDATNNREQDFSVILRNMKVHRRPDAFDFLIDFQQTSGRQASNVGPDFGQPETGKRSSFAAECAENLVDEFRLSDAAYDARRKPSYTRVKGDAVVSLFASQRYGKKKESELKACIKDVSPGGSYQQTVRLRFLGRFIDGI
ncbi:c-Maf-inducing protein-like [Tropilaelaps mercedesae]|uniref:C-Maf-inducing protein-like n=1 Tax=Tropilaelaps mercedesae TaxID=418985 RepID=A0A1V9WZ76_9ACAR|nr:c-Maf-inducing protein-like [Tropilaelaps mercedesae]